jgi:hypothetical protein
MGLEKGCIENDGATHPLQSKSPHKRKRLGYYGYYLCLKLIFHFKEKEKRKEGIKELKQKPHAIIVTWSYLSSMTKFF